ncbi:arginine--tRNA ligase [Amygdalobacter nucleatus]|uniref:Arginine--tRNA ligase n=1 Tax=Amygdalobacter nucleatus TaxID=3029274 RepID=A0A133YH19_9FIRM|nr:arginine--tRNA ligase [Amygdalobacter nucleatus]KXB42483.1 arginine--tRNA ligase [Amygdalobacter nucleatus]MDF0486057.1 arginine--tRNA ligase [Amygdalobacter nucleatus]WEG37387.1 arginine--tRNA ligase [Amygdalobacter nucleatus]
MNYKLLLAKAIKPYAEMDEETILNCLEAPPKMELGDAAFPCFNLAKTWHKAPQMIAADLASKLQANLPEFISEIKVQGPYLNFFFDRKHFLYSNLHTINQEQTKYGCTDLGKDKTVLLEYSSPNIAKPFHVGHAFTTILGASLARLYETQSYNVVRLNHLGDYGTQFGKLIVAYEKWGDEAALEQNPINELLRIYVKFHQEAKLDSTLDTEARLRFKNLELGKEYETKLWQRFKDLSLVEFNRIYKRLHVDFDCWNGESFYSDLIPAVVQDLRDKHLLEESEGAQVVRLDEENLPPCLVLKSDGTTIYASRDLAAIMYRYKRWHFAKNIYVVGTPQALHFKQVFAVLKKAGYDFADNCVHVGFGLVKFPDAKFSTREGKVVLLEDLLNEAVNKTKEIIEANNANRADKMSDEEIADTAEKIGVSAIMYIFQKSGRERDIVFDWKEILSFEGESGPYLQYTYARAKSILRKAFDLNLTDKVLKSDQGSKLLTLTLEDFSNFAVDESAYALVKELSKYKEVLQSAIQQNEPFVLTRSLNNICRAFNRFYTNNHILTAEAEQKQILLAICQATCQVLENGFKILGLAKIERM